MHRLCVGFLGCLVVGGAACGQPGEESDTSAAVVESQSAATIVAGEVPLAAVDTQTPGLIDESNAAETSSDADPEGGEATCGNSVLEEGELCDGAAYGELSCRSYGFAGGALGCANTCDAAWVGQCTPLSFFTLATSGDALHFEGALQPEDPSFRRPNEACEPGAQEGFRFDSWGIVNNSDHAQRIVVNANFGSSDGYLHAFGTPFDPQSLEGCMVGNDDLGDIGKSGFTEMVLAPHQRLVLVVSTYSAGETIDAYSLDVTTVAENPGPPGTGGGVVQDPTGDADLTASCGNGVIESGEICDGANLSNQSCAAMGHSFGVVVCSSSCDFYISFCVGGDTHDVETGDVTPPAEPGPVAPDAPLTWDDPAPIAPLGQVQQVMGSLDETDPVHQRVDEGCSAKTVGGYHYDVLPIMNSTGTSQQIQLTANFAEDGFLAVYTEDFDDALPGAGCIAADDDFSANDRPNAALSGARIDALTVEANEVLYIVVTAYDSEATLGSYSVDIKTVDGDTSAAVINDTNRPSVLTQGTIHSNDATFDADGMSRFLDTHLIQNTSSKTLDLNALATWQGSPGALYVYTHNATAEHGLDDRIASHHNSSPSFSYIPPEDLFILPGETLVVVVTSAAENQAIGMYDLSINLDP